MTPQPDAFKVTARRKPTAKTPQSAPSSAPPKVLEKPSGGLLPSFTVWVVLGGLLLLPQITFAVLHLAVAVTFAALLEPLVSFLVRRQVPRLLASFLVLGGAVLMIAAALSWLAPLIAEEIAKLSAALSADAPDKLASKLSVLLLKAMPWLRTKSILQQLQVELAPRIAALMQSALTFEVALLSNFVSYAAIALCVFYVLQWREPARRKIVSALPNRYLEMGALFLEKITPQISRYLRTQALLALCASVVLAAGFYLMGLPGVFIMSMYGALTLLTPYWGAFLGTIPLAVVGMNATNSFHVVFGIVLALATMQLLVNILLSSPRFSQSGRLHPLEALVVLLLGGSLGGVWGILLGGPLAALCKSILQEAFGVRKRFRV